MLNRSQRLWMTGLILFFLANGCAVNEARDVRKYRDVLDAGKSMADVCFHPEDPLTLSEAMQLANAHNEQLAIAGEDYLQALINKDRAFAAFLPTITFVPEFMRQRKTALGADNPLVAEFVPAKTTDVPVKGSMNLHPFRDAPAIQAAGSSARMQKAMLLDRQSILMLDVAETYFQIMHSEEQITVLQHSIKVNKRRLMDARVKEKAGVARPMDVSLAEAQLAGTRNSMIQAQEDAKSGRAMLAFLIGGTEVNGPLTNDLEVPPGAWPIAPLQELANSHRQDLIAAREQVNIAAAALEAAWGEYFPSVSLNLTSYLSRESFPSDVDWTSTIRINVPIFSAGLIHADVRTAYSRLRQARLAEMHIQRLVSKELQVALENLHGDHQQIDQLAVQVRAAQDGLTQADAAFNTGLGTNLERLTAQDGLLSAKLALSTAKFNRCVDYLRLLRATGALNPDLSFVFSPGTTQIHEMKNE
jgi:outer membrane protein TolC